MSFLEFLLSLAVPGAFILGVLFGGLVTQTQKNDTRSHRIDFIDEG